MSIIKSNRKAFLICVGAEVAAYRSPQLILTHLVNWEVKTIHGEVHRFAAIKS